MSNTHKEDLAQLKPVIVLGIGRQKKQAALVFSKSSRAVCLQQKWHHCSERSTFIFPYHHYIRMPLVILSGLPSSGKTARAQELKQFFETRLASQTQEDPAAPKAKDYRIHIVNDESLNLNKHVSYNTAADEKKARGALMSAVERLLSKEDIVIVDSLNYIKGFRYQLYCVARAIGTPHCVVRIAVKDSQSWTSHWITESEFSPIAHS